MSDKFLVIAAHPDDEILGAGGTIAKMISSGAEGSLLIVTDGSTGQYRDNSNLSEIIAAKRQATYKAAEILGIKKIMFGNLPDMRLDSLQHIEVNEVIEKAIMEEQPQTVFTHFYGDVNLDHQLVYSSTITATRPFPSQCVKTIYAYRVPSSTEWSPQITKTVFMPNYYVDISSVAEKKYRALACYEEELRPYPHPRSIESVRISDKATGLDVGLECAEAFSILRKIDV